MSALSWISYFIARCFHIHLNTCTSHPPATTLQISHNLTHFCTLLHCNDCCKTCVGSHSVKCNYTVFLPFWKICVIVPWWGSAIHWRICDTLLWKPYKHTAGFVVWHQNRSPSRLLTKNVCAGYNVQTSAWLTVVVWRCTSWSVMVLTVTSLADIVIWGCESCCQQSAPILTLLPTGCPNTDPATNSLPQYWPCCQQSAPILALLPTVCPNTDPAAKSLPQYWPCYQRSDPCVPVAPNGNSVCSDMILSCHCDLTQLWYCV
jgi:hypothetical protein